LTRKIDFVGIVKKKKTRCVLTLYLLGHVFLCIEKPKKPSLSIFLYYVYMVGRIEGHFSSESERKSQVERKIKKGENTHTHTKCDGPSSSGVVVTYSSSV